MNVGIETVVKQFLFWEYLFQIFGIVSLQWGPGDLIQSRQLFKCFAQSDRRGTGDLEAWPTVIRVRRSYSFSFETGGNVSVSHFASNRNKNLVNIYSKIYSFSLELGKNVNISHFASNQKKVLSEFSS
jgi:hypothetical protein